MPDSIYRVEDRGDRLSVVTRRWMDIADYRSTNPLTREYDDLFTEPVGKDRVRVGTAAHPDGSDSFHIHGANGIYAEVLIEERELTDSEIEWCDGTFMYSNPLPETVIEFEIPHPESLRAAIFDQNLDAYPELTTRNPAHDARHEILTTLQESIEQERLRKTKLNWMKGYPTGMDPEWDPDNSHNDDRDADHLKDMAGMRCDAHLVDFDTIAGFGYYTFFYSRARHLGIHEPHLDYYDIVALEIADATDSSYCRLCGGIMPEDQFLHVQRRGYDEGRTLRVCDECADNPYSNRFEDDDVAAAKDKRAQRLGGQRRLAGDYTADVNNE